MSTPTMADGARLNPDKAESSRQVARSGSSQKNIHIGDIHIHDGVAHVQSMQNGDQMYREGWQVSKHRRTDPETLLQRLCNYDPAKAHRRLAAKRLENTTKWFMNHGEVQHWLLTAEKTSLWLCGGVGSGKTIMCTALIDSVLESRRPNSSSVVYYYFETSNPPTLKTENFVRSLIKQLVQYAQSLSMEAGFIWDELEKYFTPQGLPPDTDDLLPLLCKLCLEVPNIIMILDGLDEIDKDELPQLQSILSSIHTIDRKSKVFISSRSELGADIIFSWMNKIKLHKIDTGQDVEDFVDAQIKYRTENQRPLTDNITLLEELKYRLCRGADGMFLWVKLLLDMLWTDCQCDSDIRETLEKLPKDLYGVYDLCLERIQIQGRSELALKTLRWVIGAMRPLSMDEIREAVGCQLTHSRWDDELYPHRELILASCANLVHEDSTDRCIRLTHSSVKQYLCDLRCGYLSFRPILSEPWIQRFEMSIDDVILDCGQRCINYLNFSDFEMQLERTCRSTLNISARVPSQMISESSLPKSAKKVFSNIHGVSSMNKFAASHGDVKLRLQYDDIINEDRYKLLPYARQFWALHTKKIDQTSPVWSKFCALATAPQSHWKLHPWAPDGESSTSNLHAMFIWASREPHMPLLDLLVGDKSLGMRKFCNIPCDEDRLTAIQGAARSGHAEVIELLVPFCNINAIGPDNMTALAFASEKGHLEAVRVILKTKKLRGNYINHENDDGRSALSLAAKNGHRAVLSELLMTGKVMIDSKDRMGKSPLMWAASNGHSAVVTALLSTGKANINSRDLGGNTPLALAARWGEEAIVSRLLLNTAVDVNLKDENYDTPLSKAVYFGHDRVVARLLKVKDIDVNSRNRSGKSPLLVAVKHKHEAILAQLLNIGNVDVNTTGRGGFTPLFYAIEQQNEAAVAQLLASKSINGNLKSSRGHTPLLWAVKKGHEGIIAQLLESTNVDVNQASWDGLTLLAWAAARGHQATVARLLTYDRIKVNLACSTGRTPLTWAAVNGHQAVVTCLLKSNNIDVNWVDLEGGTPLTRAAENGHKEIVAQLLAHSDINPDFDALELARWTHKAQNRRGRPSGRLFVELPGYQEIDRVSSHSAPRNEPITKLDSRRHSLIHWSSSEI